LRCVDVIRFEVEFGFKEFRREPEDAGRWMLVADFTSKRFPSEADAVAAARAAIPWLTLLSD